MAVRKMIWVTTQFEGFHQWEGAPVEHKYLRNTHRHLFHVKVWKDVEGSDREVEFIEFQRRVSTYCRQLFGGGKVLAASCEQMAALIGSHFGAYRVDVSEDGENGASVIWERE